MKFTNDLRILLGESKNQKVLLSITVKVGKCRNGLVVTFSFYQVFAGEWRNCVMGTGYKAKHRLPPPSEYRLSWETAAHMHTG